MLFLARYEIPLANLEMALAKRLEWETAQPEGFRIVCEYAIHGQPPPFGGFMVFETDQPDDLNALVIFYGSTVTFDIRPCSDVKEALKMTRAALGRDGDTIDLNE